MASTTFGSALMAFNAFCRHASLPSCGACAFFFDGPFVPEDRLPLLRKHGVTVYCAPGTELSRVVGEVRTADEVISEGPSTSATPVAEQPATDLNVDRTQLPDDLAAMSDAELADEALATLQRADKALSDGDPVTYQTEMARLHVILEALSGSDAEATPVATPGQ